MLPYWRQTVTHYHRTDTAAGTAWVRSIIKNCFFKATTGQSRMSGATLKADGFVCRFSPPLSGSPVSVGDILVRGEVADAISEYMAGSRSTDLLAKYAGDVMVVHAVSHNDGDGLPIPHICVRGS